MRALLALPLVFACSKAAPSASPTNVGHLIVPEAVGVAMFRPNEFPFLALLDGDGFDMQACWRELELKLTATYQVFMAPSRVRDHRGRPAAQAGRGLRGIAARAQPAARGGRLARRRAHRREDQARDRVCSVAR